mmetsp:Transcript_6095/g.19224  ORF Transcript_6095/g.19224 Transcript_6095/m.19224 type:complete len:227 (-) Transcript_6095:120-800(-)
MEREAKMRAVIRKVRNCGVTSVDGTNGILDADAPPLTATAPDIVESSRPMWALTEEQATKAVEGIDSDEANELLDFAQSLDFDKYINDSEISALIHNVRSRISELESSRLPEGPITKHLKSESSNQALPTGSSSASPERADDIPGSVVVARSVLESETGRSVGAIHSHKSLAAVAERSRVILEEHKHSEEGVHPPLVVEHADDAGSRLDGKNSVSNLPYMHRNPAI